MVAGGLQNMSAIPISAAMLVADQYGFTTPFAESPGWAARYGDVEVSQFSSAEMIAEKWDITREEMEAFALASHTRARTAIAEGRFANEIVPVWATFTTDECPRDTSLEKMAGLQPLAPGGRITAAVASQICDAASAMLIASERAVAGARAHAAGPHPPPLGARRRPDLDAHRPDPRHRARPGQGRHVDRRHRPLRVQRGLRLRRARVDEGDRRPARARSTSTAAASPSVTRSAPPAPG